MATRPVDLTGKLTTVNMTRPRVVLYAAARAVELLGGVAQRLFKLAATMTPVDARSSRVASFALAVMCGLVAATPAQAQPFNVRTWYAKGQVFVVWQFPAPPAFASSTVEIYASAGVQATTTNMTRQGRLFFPEYTGARLRSLAPGATLRIPTPAGGIYTLAATEGVFAYTPRANGGLFFAVVDTGSTAVSAGNSATTAFVYNPAADPVRPHRQVTVTTAGGNAATAFIVWAEGRTDYNNSRPDVPVMANAAKNGVPHVFVITEPVGGVPAGPLTCAFALHGGGGNYQLFLPGEPTRAELSLSLNNGVVVTPDDTIFSRNENALEQRTTAWFGYHDALDPFFAGVRAAPPTTATIANFTQRRFFWIMDWVLGMGAVPSPYTIDPMRVAIIGHSNGGRGASHLTRLAPERFCAAVLYCPPFNFAENENGQLDYMRGDVASNLATNLPRPSAPGNLGMLEIFTPTVRISPTRRDLALTRAFFGKRDTDGAATWNAGMRAAVDSMDDSGLGYMIFWDEREHGVELWSVENMPPGPDVGQWVSPVRTRRASCQYLVDTYRANLSYPSFFDADADSSLTGQQLDPGSGDPYGGDPWGTWGGYFEWQAGTVIDLPTRWESTVFASALAPASIDNAPVTSFTASIAPRKSALYNPAPGSTVYWYARPVGGLFVTQQGTVIADANGIAPATGVTVTREDVGRIRISFSTVPLCIGTGSVTPPTSVQVCPTAEATMNVSATGSGPFLFQWQYALAGVPGVWTNLADGITANVATAAGSMTSNLTLSAIAATGNRFRCIVTNACGSVASNEATLSICLIDFNCDGFLNQEDLSGFLTAFLDESIPPGPGGFAATPCAGEPAPYDTFGYQADYNRDCSFNQEDLSGFLTEYFTQVEQPSSCLPG